MLSEKGKRTLLEELKPSLDLYARVLVDRAKSGKEWEPVLSKETLQGLQQQVMKEMETFLEVLLDRLDRENEEEKKEKDDEKRA